MVAHTRGQLYALSDSTLPGVRNDTDKYPSALTVLQMWRTGQHRTQFGD